MGSVDEKTELKIMFVNNTKGIDIQLHQTYFSHQTNLLKVHFIYLYYIFEEMFFGRDNICFQGRKDFVGGWGGLEKVYRFYKL
jgi:hypothetical protein